VYVCEGENKGDQVKLEDLNGRGVQVNKYGRICIGHWKKGLDDGLWRFLNGDDNI
jgi:hypothetical protein